MSSYIGPKPSDQVVGSAGFSNIAVGANVVLSTVGLTVGALGTVSVGNSSVNCVANTSAVYLNGNAITAHQGMRNRLINGDMKIWQRNTTYTGTAAGVYVSVDRWALYCAASVTLSQSTDVPLGFKYSAKLQRPASATTTNALFLYQVVESINMLDLASQTATITFWAKAGANYSASAGTTYAFVNTGTTADQGASTGLGGWAGSTQAGTYFFNPTPTWTKYSFTVSVGSTALELDIGFSVTPTGTAGADDSLYITGVQLEKGSVATPFEYRQYGTELALCQRYYEQSNPLVAASSLYNDSGSAVYQVGWNYSGTSAGASATVQYKQTKRAAPTVTIYTTNTSSSASAGVLTFFQGSWTTATAFVSGSGVTSFQVGNSGTGTTGSSYIQFNWSSSAEL